MKPNKPIILELAGIPASGKSSLHKLLREKKKSQVIDRYSILKFFSTDSRKRIIKIIAHCGLVDRKYIAVLDRVTAKYQDSDYAYYYLIGLYYFASILHRLHPNREILFDEGFVQHLSSLSFSKRISLDDDLQELIRMIQERYQVEVLYCDVDIRIAVQRMRSRGRNDRYNSVIDDKTLIDVLSVKKQNIELVLESFKPFRSLDMNGELQEVVDSII